MKLELNLFNSRLAKRIFATFIACAMTPVIILAALSLYQVSGQLQAQAHQRASPGSQKPWAVHLRAPHVLRG